MSIMRDPVIAVDGHSYERAEIERWFAAGQTRSPKTNATLFDTLLVPNHALRNTIEDYLKANPLALRATATMTSVFVEKPVTASATQNGSRLHVSVSVDGPAERQPCVVIAIVDNSGSMGESAELKDSSESYGFTRQDLVGHGLNTLAAILGPEDMLAVVKFSTQASVVMRPTRMDDVGKARVKDAVASIKPDSQTNIFEGCRLAMDLASSDELKGRHIVGLLLTDGLPNVNPPRGILQTLRSLPMKNPWTLSTFGFGYNLDSSLLAELAEWGGGVFGFIPDCTMVGTVLINFLANMLSTGARNAVLQIGSSELHTGVLQVEQARNFVLDLPHPVESIRLNGQEIPVTVVETLDEFAVARQTFVKALGDAFIARRDGKALDDSLVRVSEIFSSTTNPKIKDLLRDIKSSCESEGQVSLALEDKYWSKWGRHYLCAYLHAHLHEMCMNFKDPGLQLYGGDLFHQIQDAGDKAFVGIPAPTPSSKPKPQETFSAGSAYYAPAAPVSMANWHNQSGGCFHGDCTVVMADGSRKPIRDVVAGELVSTPKGQATVVALVICGSTKSSQPMVQLENLSITPWHPIHIAGEWCFPAQIAPYTSRPIKTVYNLVLSDHHIVYVEGYQCCTLGHGFKGPIIEHEFFGTQRVIECLKKQPGWDVGRPTFTNLVAVRDPVSKGIVDWVDAI